LKHVTPKLVVAAVLAVIVLVLAVIGARYVEATALTVWHWEISAARDVWTAIAAVIPARDEGAALSDSLMSLAGQTLRPDRIVVVVNNSTDATAAVARGFAALPGVPLTDVLVMPGRNRFRKAGALNYGIRHLTGWRRHLEDGQPLPAGISYLLTMDGDTDLDPRFLERARNVMEADPRLGGVSAACLGKRTRGLTRWSRLLLLFERIEYSRFTTSRLRRNVHTMSGAGSFYRATALNGLLAARRDVFEERAGNLVEDYETTLALKQAGWRVTANQQCTAYTDLMPTMRTLIAQRTRWVRGTVDEWRRYGWCKATWLSIAGMIAGIAATGYAGAWIGVSIAGVAGHGLHADPRYLLLAAFWSAYQGWSVKHMGWKVVLFEAALLPEAAFNVIRSYWLARAIAASYLGRAPAWS
jgi:cellulose synthase/poly-beta-1,6-N-acetylglucosamine synthase-like glycosyltransferase